MKVLLDTHIFLWAVTGHARLTATLRAQISSCERVYVSSASIWEIAIKSSLGKLSGNAEELASAIEPSGFAPLPVTIRHAAAVARLPRHHADPFDRMLIAQAFSEPLHLLTADPLFAAYGGAITVV